MATGSSMTFSLFGRDVSASRALKGVGTTADRVGGQLSGGRFKAGVIGAGVMLGNLATDAIYKVVGGIGDVIDTQGDFESTMNVFAAMTSSTGATMARMSDLAIKMGQDTVFSANESASAMLELAKAGLSPAEIEAGALSAAMTIAATEGLDLADAASIASKAMNAFELSGKDAAKIADALAGGSNASTASVESLGAGLKYVGATAHQFRLSLNDTVGALAALNSAGLDGTTAGTSLNRLLIAMSPTTDKAAKTFKQLGLSFFDSNGQMKDMAGITKTLTKTFGDMGDAERTAAMKRAFGIEGMRAANILLQTGTEKVGKYVEATKKQGAAEDLANARMKGTKGAIEQMSGAFETLALKIGTLIAPAVVFLATKAAELASWLANNLGPAMKKVGDWAEQNLVPALQKLWDIVSENLQPAVESLGQFWRDTLLPALKDAWPTIQKIAEAAAAMAAGLVILWSVIFGKVVPVLTDWWSFLIKVGRVIGVVIGKLGDMAAKTIEVTRKILDKGREIVDWFKALPGKIKDAVTGFATLLWNAGRSLIEGLINGVKSMVGSAVDAVKGVGSGMVDGLKGLLGIHSPSKVFEALGLNVTEGLVAGLRKGSADAIAQVKTLGGQLVDRAKAVLAQLRSDRSSLVGGLVSGSGLSSVTGTGANGELTTADVVGGFAANAARIKAFAANLAGLRKLGLRGDLIRQILNMGPEQGSQVAKALLAGGAGAVSSANASQVAIAGAAKGIADAQYGGAIADARRGVRAARKVEVKVQNIFNAPQDPVSVGRETMKALRQYRRASGDGAPA